MKGQNNPGKVNARRIVALNILEAQLKTGTKPYKGMVIPGDNAPDYIPLEDNDITRIKNEIAILKSRITTEEVARSIRSKKSKAIR